MTSFTSFYYFRVKTIVDAHKVETRETINDKIKGIQEDDETNFLVY